MDDGEAGGRGMSGGTQGAQTAGRRVAGRQAGSGQKRAKGPNIRWTAKMKNAFLDHLAATCNVRAAAVLIGVPPLGVYALRRRDATFAAAWGEALAAGYEMLETQLVGHALEGGGPMLTNGAVEATGPIDVDLAIRLLSTHRGAMLGKHARSGPARHLASKAETDAAILRKLAAIKARRSPDA